ncbi:MAG: tRNA (adenosine(37)-N6)-dimethylallyltransferase MiaA [Selenomonadales bacterium]|nr:tRNA (adenosine(37)-N6)-dimethylallyltransferase MiaA [Selenomonadales bacterium]
MDKLIVVLGPTAVGKTALSIALAKRFSTEVISGDSMLIYRNMDIGTAKPSIEEQDGVVHHLVDIIEPTESFDVTTFIEMARAKIREINERGQVPILAGGTGLYIKALLEGYQFNVTPQNEAFRQEMETVAREQGVEELHRRLAEVQPETAARLHPNDIRRVIRALEVATFGGETVSQEKEDETACLYDVAVIGLTSERSLLYERINQRVDQMMADGLLDEVKGLLESGVPADAQSMKGIGYKELVAYLDGKCTLEEAVDEIKKGTRHFAKRQFTWYRKMPYIDWYEVKTKKDIIGIEKEIAKKLTGKFFFL